MDGKNFKVINSFDDYFKRDSFGCYIPNPSLLRMDKAKDQFVRQLKADTGFYSRLAAIYERTDVQFTNNPLGNTPVVGAGVPLFGKRPLNVKRGEKNSYLSGHNSSIAQKLEKRQNKLYEFQRSLMAVHSKLEPVSNDDQLRLLWDVESDQMMTGGGFDNNSVGGVHASALNFIINSSEDINFADSELSEIFMESCIWVRELLKSYGLREGSIQPMGASHVRAEQDNDGMFGFPVYSSGNDALDNDLAVRLLVLTGVDTRDLVGSKVVDKYTGVSYDFRVIDAAAYILDHKVFTYDELLSLVTLLARIQKHGYKEENGKLVAKDGKTRSVYPNAFIPAVVEAMIFAPFNDKLKELKAPILPSLQDKPTRVGIVKKQILDALHDGYDYLAADWSKYDSSVKGCMLATMIQEVVKPFIDAKYYYWIDVATYILVYKYLILDTNLAKISADAYQEAIHVAKCEHIKNWDLFGLVDGLISGAKFTHVGGSLYGECVIHYGIGRLIGWKPIPGAQAGDDTLMGVPLDRIDTSDVHKTYDPIEAAAKRWGLKMNVGKQIWHQAKGEVVKVFLQDNYHAATETWGVGSAFRWASSVFMSEMDKGLTIPEQLMAEIARANTGSDSPFIEPVVNWWLSYEQFLGYLFQTKGTSGYQYLIDAIGKDPVEIAKSIGVGSFSFGVSREDMRSGNLPILDVMARVSKTMTFDSARVEKAFGGLKNQEESSSLVESSEFEDDDSIE